MGPDNESVAWKNSVRDGIQKYTQVNAVPDDDLAQCLILGNSLLDYAKHMDGALALKLSDWLSDLAMVAEDRAEKRSKP